MLAEIPEEDKEQFELAEILLRDLLDERHQKWINSQFKKIKVVK